MANQSTIDSKSFEDTRGWFVPTSARSEELSPPSYELQPLDKISKKEKTKSSWRSLFAFTSRQHTAPVACALLASLSGGIVKPAAAIIFGKIFSAMAKFGGGTLDGEDALHEVATWSIALAALGIAAWVIEGTFLSLWITFGELQAKSARQKMFSGMLDKDMEWYDMREDGIASLLIRIETQIRELQLAVSQPLGFLLYEAIAALASIGTALFFSWKLALVILATLPVAAGLLFILSRGVSPAIERQNRELSRASKYASTAVTAIDTVKAFNGQDQEVWQYFSTTRKVTKNYLVQARSNALQFGVSKLLMVGLFVQGFWYGLYLVTKGLDPGRVLTTFYSCLSAMQAIETVLPQFLVLAKGMSAGETLKSIMIEMDGGRNTTNMNGDLKPNSCTGDIEVNNISFAYPSNTKQLALSNATFFFPAGEITFLVGKSGSGKSTVGNLLMKYYDGLSGEILVDGHPIQRLDTDWVRQNVTLVQQQSVLFNETILQNIALGKTESSTVEEVRWASETACLGQTISEMPEGLGTLVGSNNRSLSGGQTQRIAIARARLRDAPILILDESTSALDLTSRIEVINRIRKWRLGKTTIIVTHDVSQILDNDYVYVLQDGKVIQEGYRKNLNEKSHGVFDLFLGNGEEVLISSDLRGKSESGSPMISHAIDSFEECNAQRWGTVSGMFSTHDSPANLAGRSTYIGSNQLSLGVSVAQSNELRADDIWLSPIIPDSPQMSSPREPPVQFTPFMSPRPSPQIPSGTVIPRLKKENQGFRNSLTSNEASPQPKLRTSTPSIPSTGGRSTTVSMTHKVHEIGFQESLHRSPAPLTKIFGSIWPAIDWQERMMLVLGFFAAFVVAAATPAFAYVYAQLLNTFYITENRASIARTWALSMLGIAVVDGTAAYCTHYFLEHSGQAWISSLRVEALKRILDQPKSWFDKERNSPSRLTECLDRDAEEMRNLLGRFAGLMFTVFWMLGISIVWAFILDWKLTLVALACAPVMYVITRVFHWVSGKWEDKCNQASEASSNIFTETFSNIRVVRALTLGNHFEGKHRKATADTYKIGQSRAVYSGLMFGLIDALGYFIIALVFYYGMVIIVSGDRTVGRVFEVIDLLLFGIANATAIFAMVPQINSSRTTATEMLLLANLSPQTPSHELQGTKRLASPFPIKMDDLSFTYPCRPNIRTLNGISLTITAGSCTAVVGPSGSGKSTIASILLGLYPPDSQPNIFSPPPLTFSGNSILDCNISSLRTHMSIVPQTPLLFPTTIFSNIVYGLPELSPFNNILSVEQAAIDAGIHDFVTSCENGYNTLIGEGGMGLSGGQSQRIAIARALVRKPKLLVLDEATSALDGETAEGIRETVQRLKENSGMAVVIISHNMDMMRIADMVIVVENGKIVERGGFEELKGRGGPFAQLIGGESGAVATVLGSGLTSPVCSSKRDE